MRIFVMADRRSAVEKVRPEAKRDAKVRGAIRKVLKPKNWADDVIGRPIEVVEQINDWDQPNRRSA